MENQGKAHDLLTRLLDEQYGKGRAAGWTEGHRAGRDLGYDAGYNDAMKELAELAEQLLEGRAPDTNGADAEPEPEPEQLADDCPPYMQRALEYVREHPGATSAQAERALKNSSVLYKLHDLGLLEKRGPQFFLKNSEAIS